MKTTRRQQLLGYKAAAEFLGISKTTLYRMVANGELPFMKIGADLRFDVDKLRNWIDQQHRVAASELRRTKRN